MAKDKNKNARAQCDRYLISAIAGGCDFHAYLICPPDRTEISMRRLTNLLVSAIEHATSGFWAPIVLATKLKTGREVEKLLFKNCPEIEGALKADPSNGGSAVWAAEAADPDSIALMDLH